MNIKIVGLMVLTVYFIVLTFPVLGSSQIFCSVIGLTRYPPTERLIYRSLSLENFVGTVQHSVVTTDQYFCSDPKCITSRTKFSYYKDKCNCFHVFEQWNGS
jgi:hypothetical protein